MASKVKTFKQICSRYSVQRVEEYLFSHEVTYQELNEGFLAAVSAGRIKTVVYLLGKGANVAYDENMAICLASQKGFCTIVGLLCHRGADVEARDHSPVKLAFENGHHSLVRMLNREFGADLSYANIGDLFS